MTNDNQTELDKDIMDKIHYYSSLKIDNAEFDARKDIDNNAVKIFIRYGSTVSLIQGEDVRYEDSLWLNFETIPTYSLQNIGEGGLIFSEIYSTDMYKRAYNNAIAYAHRYNKFILDYYNVPKQKLNTSFSENIFRNVEFFLGLNRQGLRETLGKMQSIYYSDINDYTLDVHIVVDDIDYALKLSDKDIWEDNIHIASVLVTGRLDLKGKLISDYMEYNENDYTGFKFEKRFFLKKGDCELTYGEDKKYFFLRSLIKK